MSGLSGTELVWRLLAAAREDLARGIHEEPDGSNRGPGITELGEPGQPWCALLLSAWLRRAGLRAPDGSLPPMIDGARDLVAWWAARGRGLPVAQAARFLPGGVVLFERHDGAGRLVGHHVELVESDDDRALICLGGNVRNAVRRSERERVVAAARPIPSIASPGSP